MGAPRRLGRTAARIALTGALVAASAVAFGFDIPTRMKPETARVAACFTPGEDCESEIVQAIAAAERHIQVQAYSFTSLPIIHALRVAVEHGIVVELVLDKSDGLKDGAPKLYSPAGLLAAAGASVWIDNHAGIAHNKIIIIDGTLTIGGSFNYSKNAATRNRENVTFIDDTAIAAAFAANWEARRSVSLDFNALLRQTRP